jgi:hypothetical protein
MMTIEEAMKNVRGMVASLRYEETRPRQRDWMHEGGFEWIIDPDQSCIHDTMPKPWRVDAALCRNCSKRRAQTHMHMKRQRR